MEQLLTVAEVAHHLRVSRTTVWRWCKNGTLKSAFKVGRAWRIPRAELESHYPDADWDTPWEQPHS